MNENTPPLPQPSGATCPNCGAAQDDKAPFCTHCGAPLQAATPSKLSSGSKLALSLSLGCGALVFGAVGGCFAFLGRIEGGNSFDPAILLFVGVPALLALACIWGIFKIQRK